MEPPEIKYASTPEGAIAYQVLGEGPIDLVFRPAYNDCLDVIWDQPAYERYLRRLASFSRLILFNPRSSGLSDPHRPHAVPSIEEVARDIASVMSEVRSERAVLLGIEQGGAVATWFAAAHPEKTASLVLVDPLPRLARAPDYPWGMPPDVLERFFEGTISRWGTGGDLELIAPESANNPALRNWYARLERAWCTPQTYGEFWRQAVTKYDYRSILPLVRSPTLVVSHAKHPWIRPEHGRNAAERIPNAQYEELPGFCGLFWLHDVDAVLNEIAEFVSGELPDPSSDERVLSTVLFSDVVRSTERAVELGDRKWRELLDALDAAVSRQLDRFQGRLIKTDGDSILATFEGPARAIRCGFAIRDDLRLLGIDVRTGVHTGEVELRGADIGGISVHIGARVMAAAEAGEVLVTSTVRDLAPGSGIVFEDRGLHTLKGVPEDWRLFAAQR